MRLWPASARRRAVLFGISVLVFLIFFATPGADPAARLAGRGASPDTLAAVRIEFGLDRPLPVQYARLMRRLFVTGDLTSFSNRGQAVVPAVLAAAPVTLLLSAGAAVLWLAGGLAIALLATASRTGGRFAIGAGLVGMSIPAFWLGEVVNLLTQRASMAAGCSAGCRRSAWASASPAWCCRGRRWRCSMPASTAGCCTPGCGGPALGPDPHRPGQGPRRDRRAAAPRAAAVACCPWSRCSGWISAPWWAAARC